MGRIPRLSILLGELLQQDVAVPDTRTFSALETRRALCDGIGRETTSRHP